MDRVALSLIHPHPGNPNYMGADEFEKLSMNMERTGKCPAIDLRDMQDGRFQILDGHHRVKVAIKLGWTDIPHTNWGPMSDEEAGLLLLTLNRLRGKDNRRKRQNLIDLVSRGFDDPDFVARMLPDTAEQIAKSSLPPPEVNDEKDQELADNSEPFTCLLRSDWTRVINAAIKKAKLTGALEPTPSHETHGGIAEDLRRGAALYHICSEYLLK
jgi:ParB-like chromosome segregation protein Spo0J